MSKDNRKKIRESLAKRNRSERHFQWFGKLGVILGLAAVVLLFVDIISKGSGAFRATYIQLEIEYDPDAIGVLDVNDKEELIFANWQNFAKKSLRDLFPEVTKRGEKRKLNNLVSEGAGFDFRDQLAQSPNLWGTKETLWILADDDIDTYYKSWLDGDPFSARLTSEQVKWIDQLHSKGLIALKFNTKFFERGDSREPEQAGIKGALIGSFFTLILTLLMSFPMGVTAAIYLEEFAPKNKWTDLIEVNINNLAAVPSIIFGLLGLAIFINFFGIPRSIPVLGAIVLALMTLPTIIITSRAAIKSVPPSIREAALGVGASKFQTTLHHVLPLSLPGMLTGAIIGMARALGETAPLLMIGMVAFIVDIPEGFTDPATVLPVQIFLWIDSPERAFVEKTSAAIIILLSFLMVMNFVAVYLRKRLERRW
ncbi:MAG: phosphate ABC transporter permease PstA [Pseudomonadota bacterium]|jgi:phosphate transport system permease protein|nr:phosphate ABC transporter permease PstA [Pseudomonadota bacterium]GIR40055.1 MAG: phosphate transport system permease protein PstA [Porticoccaceae bacterium]MEC7390135.1 phosphate ABC transporter permease PstA [Pseudomonadota bacterium]MEC7455073.1 phosphate ABC transporter permease PstA [Pseudomonadota bacterium]MEC7620965.1 phosphate ABC transporter permease PstA [Pseudomonadota bacterium]|tara:strand:- start:3236 stop:4510 length:1275 start_codon:yes stop_codon:yes gene_type:complete